MSAFDCDFCTSRTLFGERGECDALNETCACPEGFSGKDDWLSFSGCQVNEGIQKSIHSLLSTLSALGLVVSLLCFWALLKRWKFTFSLTSSGEGSSNGQNQSFFFPPKPRNYLFNIGLRDVAVRNWKRQVYTLYSVVAYITYFIGGVLYSFPLLRGGNRQDEGFKFVLGMYITLASSLPAGFLVVVVWYYSLPNVSAFGALLKMNWFLVRYPEFVPKFLFWTGIVIEIIFFIFALIVPLTNVDDDILHICDKIVVAALVWIIFVCLGTFWLTMHTVENVFAAAFKEYERGANESMFDNIKQQELKFMKKTMTPLKVAKYMCISVLLFDLLLEVTNFVTGSIQIYLYVNLNFIVFCIFMMFAPICFVLLETYLTPK